MAGRLQFNASHQFKGVIWNTIAHPDGRLLFVEVRDERQKKVFFSAWNVETNQFLWRNVEFEEPWWISLAGAADNILLLTIYTNSNNPDQKSVLAYDIGQQKILWWRNDFSLSEVTAKYVVGIAFKTGGQHLVLDITDGQPVQGEINFSVQQNLSVIRPLLYTPGTGHFDTVKSFIEAKFALTPVAAIEYLENKSFIFISCYTGSEMDSLANYLYILSVEGECLVKERIGELLKGVGMDTFFLFSSYLIFVKNKHELVSYKMVW